MKTLIIVFLLFIISVKSYAGIEHFSSRIDNSSIVTNASFSLYDDKYFEMMSNPSWATTFTNYKVKNKVIVGLNPSVVVLMFSIFAQLLFFNFLPPFHLNLEFDEITENRNLTVQYDINGTNSINDLSTFVFEGAHKIKVKITSLSGVVASNLFIESHIDVERYYTMFVIGSPDITALTANPYPYSSSSTPFSEATNEFIDLSWDYCLGAEGYELEYVHINDYTLEENVFIPFTSLPFDYYLNSTRVELSSNYYRIPNIYDHGFFIFRVRSVFRSGTDFQNKTYGSWSAPENGFIGVDHPSDQVLTIWREYDKGMNWAHQVALVEDGKRFESVSFADGLGRGRQSVARNTATNQTVVSNVYFDEIGRVVIGDLPTPVDLSYPAHHPNFNRADVSGFPTFNYTNFDDPSTSDGICLFDQYGMSNEFGTSNYYSEMNPNKDGANGTIPDGENFPYSRMHYLNDFTGRVDRVGGVGPELTLGAGHESQYIYVTASQPELNQLFGVEVGEQTHYQKMVTVDPNGQVYVQFTDMASRVVASYMMGPSPSNLDELEDTESQIMEFPIMVNGSGQIPDYVTSSATLSYTQYFAEAEENYTVEYAFTPQQYTSICLQSPVCFDCAYDLKLKIEEKCGQVIHESTITINGEELDEICNGETSYLDTFTLTIPKGEYTFTKSLVVNQEAINEYWCMYIDNITDECLDPMYTIFNDLYNEESFPECDDQPYEAPYDGMEGCDLTKALMASDITPGGQYAIYQVSAGVYGSVEPTSIFFGVTPPYTAFNYGTITVLDPVTNTMVSPAALSIKNYVLLHDPSWATYLIENESDAHPESCMLGFCDANADSYAYDQGMLNTFTFDEAISYNGTTGIGGYFLPLTFSPMPTSSKVAVFFGMNFDSCDVHLDPFFVSNPIYEPMMEQDLNEYVQLGVGTPCFFNLWEYAVLAAYLEMNPSEVANFNTLNCGQIGTLVRMAEIDCNEDLIWTIYRKRYLELKQNYVQQAMEAYASSNCPSMPEIGTGSGSYSDKWPRFPSMEFVSETLNNGLTESGYGGATIDFTDAVTSSGDINGLVNAQLEAGCNAACEEFSLEWMERLSGCEIDPADTAEIRASFVALCMNGCDQSHPSGASTPNPNSSYVDVNTGITNPTVRDILEYYGYNKSMLCTDLLIEQPLPYDYTLQLTNFGKVPLDQCVCDKLLAAQYYLPGSGFDYPEQLFEENTGVQMDDINYLICECEEVSDENVDGVSDWVPGYVWPPTANSALAATGLEVMSELGCPDAKGCVDCSTVTSRLYDLLDYFGFSNYSTIQENYTEFSSVSTSHIILTNYLNYELGFAMDHDDYTNFIGGCLAPKDAPYCTTNPLFEELAAVLKLISFRGQLTTTSTIDLMQENIVYANSQLMEEGFGQYFSATMMGTNELNLQFDDGSNEKCNLILTLPENAAFNFEDIVSFGIIFPTSSNCSGNNTFQVEVNYFSCGILQTGMLDGTTDCFEVNLCVCGDEGQTLCNDPFSNTAPPCYEETLEELYAMTLDLHTQNIAAQYGIFKSEYNAKCTEAFDTENFSYTGPIRIYQYTLFYYDQAGNLVRTIAPEGVDLVIGQDAAIETARNLVDGPNSSVTAIVPDHQFVTGYAYNSYNQLATTTNPDQEGETQFWYDRYGRIVASQNPVQKDQDMFSFTFYDEIGRPIIVGQTLTSVPLDDAVLKVDDYGSTFEAWVSTGVRSELTVTIYDQHLGPGIDALFSNGVQENLRLRVASVLYYPIQGTLDSYESAIHYSYDIHGNVKEQIQDVPVMDPVNQQFKSTQYDFELLSGNVKKVFYQKEKLDQMIHEYHYDELNRLTEARTSTDDVHYARDAHYRYYDYGPLARVEYGEHKVQAQDFAYTINGWLKGMNASTLDVSKDIGKDGIGGYLQDNSDVHRLFAKDVNAYTLSYFQDDYKPINGNSFEIDHGSTGLTTNARNLYNGNIRSLVTSIYDMTTMGKAYHYDQLNRLKEMTAYYFDDNPGYSWDGLSSTTEYFNDYSYDKNGNILTLQRNGITANGLLMDDFAYNYIGVGANPSNRLDYVADAGLDDGNPLNLEDIKAGQTSNNYRYDKLGQLEKDMQEGLTLQWRFGDKKLRTISKGSEEINFIYNPFGQRVAKRISGSADDKTSFYSYDANGQVMAVYDVRALESEMYNQATLKELHIYGASRLGMISRKELLFNYEVVEPEPTDVVSHTLGIKFYELSNYLGNVEVVITDRKTAETLSDEDIYYDQFTTPGDLVGWGFGDPLFVGNPQAVDYSISLSSGKLIVYAGTTSGYLGAALKQSFFESGVNYQLSFDIQTSSGVFVTVGGIGVNLLMDGVVSDGSYSFNFTGNGQTLWYGVACAPGQTIILDNIRLKKLGENVYEAVVINTADYYPGGMLMPGRHTTSTDYRYGYNGMEMDNEMSGNGNSYTTEFRQYDPRLMRWKSLDPLMHQFPHMSPYVAFDNNPIVYIDPYGLSAGGPENPPDSPQEGQTHTEGKTTWEYMKGDDGSMFWAKLQSIDNVTARAPHPEWDYVGDGYNRNSGYEYNNSDLDKRAELRHDAEKMKAKWGIFSRDVLYRGICVAEGHGNALPISLGSAIEYFGSGMNLLMYMQYLGMMFETAALSPQGATLKFKGEVSAKHGGSLNNSRMTRLARNIKNSPKFSNDLTDAAGIIQNADDFVKDGAIVARQRFIDAGYSCTDITLSVSKGTKQHQVFKVVNHSHIEQIQFSVGSSRHGGNYVKISMKGMYKGKIKVTGKGYNPAGEKNVTPLSSDSVNDFDVIEP